ncbi:hypothetical protein JCM1840_006818 [Sporobolomyces johnsonii]
MAYNTRSSALHGAPADSAQGHHPPEPSDRLTTLSPELISLVFDHLTMPVTVPVTVPRPDLATLARLCLVNKRLLPHVRAALYWGLEVTSQGQGDAICRILSDNDVIAEDVRAVTVDVEVMARTSCGWEGLFLFRSMRSLLSIISSCTRLVSLTLYLPGHSSAWTQSLSLCDSLRGLEHLRMLVKDLEPSASGCGDADGQEEMDIGWRPRFGKSMWAVSHFLQPLAMLKCLDTLRLCGISSNLSTASVLPAHSLELTEVVLVNVDITELDLRRLLGKAEHLEHFTLWRSSLLRKGNLVHLLGQCPNLIEHRVGGSWFSSGGKDAVEYPLDTVLASLLRLKLVHVSGPLISPVALLLKTLTLDHLLVHGSPSFSPSAVHVALVKMPFDPPSVARLTLPEMRLGRTSDGSNRSGVAGAPDGWNKMWRNMVKKTEAAVLGLTIA